MKQNKNGRNVSDARSDAAQKEMATVIATVNNIVGTWSRENRNRKSENTKVRNIYAKLKRAAVNAHAQAHAKDSATLEVVTTSGAF